MAKKSTISTSRSTKTTSHLPAVISTLEDVISNKQSPVDIKKFAYLFMEKIGGAPGFVDKVLEEYNGSEVGSLARSRVLEIMMRLFQLATPKETFGDYSEVSDDDLKNMLKEHLGVPAAAPAQANEWPGLEDRKEDANVDAN